jgi:hypothetical protein
MAAEELLLPPLAQQTEAVAAAEVEARHLETLTLLRAAPASSSSGIGGPRDARVLLCPY